LALIGLIFVSKYFLGILWSKFWSLDTNFKMKRELSHHCHVCTKSMSLSTSLDQHFQPIVAFL